MLNNIFELLELAKEENNLGKYTAIALGKYKYPENLKEGFKQLNKGLWQK